MAPFYEEWWFLVVVALVGLIFILLLVFILIIRGQSKKYAKKSDSGWSHFDDLTVSTLMTSQCYLPDTVRIFEFKGIMFRR